jgi:hypothetical protein
VIVPAINAADAIIAAIAAATTPLEIVFPAGTTNIDKPIDLPNSKRILIRGEVGAKVVLTSTVPGDCIFRVKNDGHSWEGSLVVRDLSLRSRMAANQTCFGADQADKVNHNQIHLEDLWMTSTGYNVRFDNQEYTVAPTFRNLRGNNGLYWSGATHSASNLLVENCRFQSGTRGPQIYIDGARAWTLRNNICEGSSRLDADIDPDAADVRRTWGILITNPGPTGGTLESQYYEFWNAEPTDYFTSIFYGFNNGGSQKCSTYTAKNFDIRRMQIVNTSNTDELTLSALGCGWQLPDFSDPAQFKCEGKVSVIVSGSGTLNNKYRFDNPKVKIDSCVAVMGGFDPIPYRDSAAILYAYKGGTGIYHQEATAGNWANCRPYVQHHPKHGHSIVMKATTKLDGVAFFAPLKTLGNGRQVQEMWACCPHLELTGTAPTSGNSYGAGMMSSIGNRFMYESGHSPKRYIGLAESSTVMPFVKCISSAATPTSGKWLQLFSSTAWKGGFGEPQPIPNNYDCYKWPNEPGPPLGTSIVGDVCRAATTKWTCTEAGTSRPIAITGSLVKGVAELSEVSDITELLVGDFLLIEGVIYRVLDIAAGKVKLDRKAAVSAVAVAVVNQPPQWSERN